MLGTVASDLLLWIWHHSTRVLKGGKQQSLEGHTLEPGVRLSSVAEERGSHMLWLPYSQLARSTFYFSKVVKVNFIQLEGHLNNCLPLQPSYWERFVWQTEDAVSALEKVYRCQFGQMRFTYFETVKEP